MRRALFAVVASALCAAPACKRAAPAPASAPAASSSASAGDPAAAAEGRCRAVAPEAAWVLAPDGAGGDPDATDEMALPFADEVGEAVAIPGGWAVGAVHGEAHGSALVVVRLSSDARSASIVRLGAAHGDAEPPRVAPRGAALVVGVVEPGPDARSLRLGRVEGAEVHWGASWREGRDESLAFDVALGERRGVAVWDDEDETTRKGVIRAVSFDAETLAPTGLPRAVSPAARDAESPRLAPRPGGFWLSWVARKPVGETAETGDASPRFSAQPPENRWIEVVPIDEAGLPAGQPRAASPAGGHVLVYDLAAGDDGAALLVWREDDGPVGAQGGRLARSIVRASGVEPPDPIETGQGAVAAGVPRLLPGWLVVAGSAGVGLAPIAGSGAPVGPIREERSLGMGEPIGATAGALLVARPRGRAVALSVLGCDRAARSP